MRLCPPANGLASSPFAKVCNLVNARGEVLALQTTAVPLGPLSWQVPTLPPVSTHAAVKIEAKHGLLRLGTAVFNWQGSQLWAAKPAWQQLKGRTFQSPSLTFPPLLQTRWQQYLAALAVQNEAEMMKTAVALAGMGTGLTPSGDDLLVGSFYALWAGDVSPNLLARLGMAAAEKTSTLSASFLRAAAAGEAVAPWHALVAGLPNAVDQITAVGHHSGRESWFSFCETHTVLAKMSWSNSNIRGQP